ncbi:MAG: PRD domain-containing protein, partial [Bifidobacterium boum]|nr:PRD domain-containing protein [Bifidobacterium boum]
TLVMALADHVVGALRRAKRGVSVEYPLDAEVRSLYAREYVQGEALVSTLNDSLHDALPRSEAVAFALHLVNAGFSNGDLSYTYTMTGVIQQMLAIIEHTYHVSLGQHNVSVGRFITHLRYLFVRIYQGRQLDSEPEPIVEAIRQSYPDEVRCAKKIAEVVELRLGSSLTPAEIAYLALHVARVVADVNGRPSADASQY